MIVQRLQTTYGILVDRKTYHLLECAKGDSPDNDLVWEHQLKWSKAGTEFYLTYTLLDSKDNVYTHKAIQRWLRESIKTEKLARSISGEMAK